MTPSLKLLLLLLGAPIQSKAPEPKERAQQALQPFKQELRNALLSALKQGPEQAVDVCAKDAPQIAKRVAPQGVRLGRTALKLRNPQNQAPPWAKPLLKELSKTAKEGDHRIVPLPGGKIGYAETIVVQPLCLTCHGSALPAPVAARIKDRYPLDQATGFKEGEFRGIFWAEIPASP